MNKKLIALAATALLVSATFTTTAMAIDPDFRPGANNTGKSSSDNGPGDADGDAEGEAGGDTEGKAK